MDRQLEAILVEMAQSIALLTLERARSREDLHNWLRNSRRSIVGSRGSRGW